jgi:hypothetical protein
VVHQKFNDPEIVLLSRIFSKKSTFQRFLETKNPAVQPAVHRFLSGCRLYNGGAAKR